MATNPKVLFGSELLRVPGQLLVNFSQYWVPLLLLAVSIAALMNFDSVLTQTESPAQPFRYLEDVNADLTVSDALDRLASGSLVQFADTELSENPFWVLINLESQPPIYLDFESRHARQSTCWNAANGELIDRANRDKAHGAMRVSGTGFVLKLGAEQAGVRSVVCNLEHSGPARITATYRTEADQLAYEKGFNRSAGLMEGALLALAFITVIISVIHKELRYVTLAAWLIFNLRLAAMSMGWDQEWVGQRIPADWLSVARQFTITTYYILTYALFTQLFSNELKGRAIGWTLWAGQLTPIFLVLAALILPYAVYLPVMWVAVTSGIAVMLLCLVFILFHHPSRSAVLYSAALMVVFVSSIGEVLAAAFEWRFLLQILNSVTAAMASSLLVTMALVEKLRVERDSRIHAVEDLRHVYDSTPVALFSLNENGDFVRGNVALKEMLQLDGQPLKHAVNISDFISRRAWQIIQASPDLGSEAGVQTAPIEYRSANKQGWAIIQVAKRGEYFDGSMQDFTERVADQKKLEHLASHDSLTGLLNRQGFYDACDEFLQKDVGPQIKGIAQVNLKRFRLLNNIYRSKAGDSVLVRVANSLVDVLPKHYVVGRLAADEFLIAASDKSLDAIHTHIQSALEILNKAAYTYAEQLFQVKAQAGLVEVRQGMPSTDLITMAQKACALNSYDDDSVELTVCTKDSKIFAEYDQERELIILMSQPQLPSGLALYVQPILSVKNPKKSLNAEVLLRLHGPDGKLVPIDKVIKAAEISGNMPKLDTWVLNQTLEWMQDNQEHLTQTYFINVNLSGASLNDQLFVKRIANILDKYPAVLSKLCLEVTEGIALSDYQYINRFISDMKDRGIRVALDDFGAGYTSFAYVRHLQADGIKIDGSFIFDLSEHPANVAVASSIVDLADNLGMCSVAEGVENLVTYGLLAEIEVDYVQGYLIARPQPIESIAMNDSSFSYIEDADTRNRILEIAEEYRSVEDRTCSAGNDEQQL